MNLWSASSGRDGHRARLSPLWCALALLVGSSACGGGGGGSPTTPTPSPAPTTGGGAPAPVSVTVTITAAGVSPNDFTLAAGGTITWVNADNRVHDPSSDPHPQHTECPALNLGDMNPGQQRTTAVLSTPGVCRFHDHLNPGAAGLMGRVTIR